MSRSIRSAFFSASFALLTLAAPALATLPDQGTSIESGFPRRWHAGGP